MTAMDNSSGRVESTTANYRFSGHETFPCRYTWLPKAVRNLSENENLFTDEDEAMVRLGVGKNMAGREEGDALFTFLYASASLRFILHLHCGNEINFGILPRATKSFSAVVEGRISGWTLKKVASTVIATRFEQPQPVPNVDCDGADAEQLSYL